MKKPLYTLFLFSFLIQSVFAQNPVRKVDINIESFRQQLSTTKHENVLGIGNAKNSETIITLPLPDGSSAQFKVVEYSILPAGINTDAKTYLGEQVGNSSVGCRITVTKDKMIATILINGQIIVIERDSQSALINVYNVYEKSADSFECGTSETFLQNGRIKSINSTQDYTNGTSLRTYRMAIMVTDDFYTARGNTDALVNAEIIAIINSLNGLYEKEIAVRFTLKSPTNPASANVFYRKTEAINTYYQAIDLTRVEMNTRYGTANYDIGHTLHTTGGGVAYYGVCNDFYKGGGWSGSTTPSSILLMAHEVGHQFTAPHTFNGNGNANCSIGNRNTPTAYEPGSGTTIMSYGGTCISTQNIVGGKDPYFHTNSLDNMIYYIQTGNGKTCGTPTATGNTAPVANAGLNYTIPKNTPFTLTGSGTDANSDVLNFTWEEYDQPVAADSGKLGHTNNAVLSTTAPLFRSRQSTSPIRTFPALNFILNNANNPADTHGEDLPNVARTMVFRLTARDNRSGGGGVGMASTTISVANSEPFLVTSQNTATLWIYNGTNTATITWSKSTTDVAPISCANVKISFSADGGETFPIILAASTPNDGTHTITIPNNLTSMGRIKVEAIGNIFFDINNSDITITNTCTPETSSIIPSTAVSQPLGSANLNLSQKAVTGTINGFSGTIADTDPQTTITFDNGNGACQNSGNQTYYDIFSFIPDVSGSYTFSGLDFPKLMNIYQGSYNTANKCENWKASSGVFNGNAVNIGSSVTVNLTAYVTYNIVISGFSGVPSPASYNVTVSAKPLNANLYTPIIGTPYSYSYLIYNTDSGNIAKFEDDPDLSISATYPIGSYRIYGFSYPIGMDLSAYQGTSFSSFQTSVNNSSICGKLSTNFRNVIITSNTPCSSNLVLANPADNITTGNITKQASATNGKITATNFVTGSGTKATYQAKAIELNAGFKAETGTIFRAETGGCN